MRIVGRSWVALLGLLVVSPPVHAKKCSDTSGFDAVMEQVEAAVPCASATKHGKYVKQAKKQLKGKLSGACKREFAKQYLSRSICGRADKFEVCCSTKKGGKASRVVKKGKCAKKGGSVCANLDNPTSVGDACTASGVCETTTTTTTTTTTVAQPTTTTVPPPPPDKILEFTLSQAGGVCGTATDDSGGVLQNLTCGGLNIGGGQSTQAEGPTPDGSVSQFGLNCTGTTCNITPIAINPSVNTAGPDCTSTGCNFGTPLPIPNPASPSLSTCVLNTWSAPASGTLDLATGTSSTNVPLNSDVYITSNVAQACPRCSATGTPANPGTGTCDRGPRTGQPCTTTSQTGLTRDCLTGGADATHPCTPGGGICIDGTHVGPILVDLSPLQTSASSKTDPAGNFCPSQLNPGCFAHPTCRTITENGVPAGPITVGVPAAATLASVFCIAATNNGIVDGAASLPGPGAVSLPGTFVVKELTSTTTPTSTTIVTTTTPVTTTTTTTLPCGNSILDPGERCDPGSAGGAMLGCPDGGFCTTTCQCVACLPQDISHKTLDFSLNPAGGTCGSVQDGSSVVLKNLTCGGLSIGGGGSIVPEGPTPDGSVSRFKVTCCDTTSQCQIEPSSAVPDLNTGVPDCTSTGCNFGTPLPIPNPALPTITTCVLNTWSLPASGTLDLTTGVSTTSVPLTSDIYLTGNLAQPCPRCSATGSPASPGIGTCDRGPRAGMPCTTTSSTGVTRDCPTGGANPPTQPCTPGGGGCVDGSHVGQIAVNLTPLTTGAASSIAPDGLFCPGQGQAQIGCFGQGTCRGIFENGSAAGPIATGTPASATLASVFCIEATGNGLVDASANLPGPGAISLPGSFTLTDQP